jgi:flagellar motility protein MotE (MotC chaperone)
MRFLFRLLLVQHLVAPLLGTAALATGNDAGPPLDLQKTADPRVKRIMSRQVEPKPVKGRRADPMSEPSELEVGKPEPGKADSGKSDSEDMPAKEATKPQPRAAPPVESAKASAPAPARVDGQMGERSKEEEIRDEAKRPDSKESKKSEAKKEEPKKDEARKDEAHKEPAPEDRKADPHALDPQAYCTNIAATAADARIAWQAKRLTELDVQIKQRIADLEAKRAEFQDWLSRREEALKKAEDGVVAIYSKMRPDAAALQLAAMDDRTAAAVLVKLNPRAASAILNEMSAERAARLTNAMSGPPANPDGKKS